jgi:transcriptional regulator with GAF, ATPase, and Fis domain
VLAANGDGGPVSADSSSFRNDYTRFALSFPAHWRFTACQPRAYRETIYLQCGGFSSPVAERDQGVSFQPKCAEREAPFAVERVLAGDHPAIVKLCALIERVAPTEVTVLITGESGTGKEVVAQAIHALSPRSLLPFVAVNCAAIPHDLARIRNVRT